MRAVINRLLQPEQLAQLPLVIKPILANLRRDAGFNPAELAFLTGQLQGISTGEAEFRTVPAYARSRRPRDRFGHGPAAERIFARRSGRQAAGPAASTSSYTPPSEANIAVLVVDSRVGGQGGRGRRVLSQAGFDISPAITTYAAVLGEGHGPVIAYAPDHDAEAQVVLRSTSRPWS